MDTTNTIVKSIEMNAPVARVWDALTDYRQFGQWFRVRIDQPFEVGKASTGQMTYPGYEGSPWHATVVAIEPMERFVFTWSPTCGSKAGSPRAAETTTVEFTLEATAGGTRLTVMETGFEKIPADARCEAIRSHTGGWEEQLGNIAAHVRKAA